MVVLSYKDREKINGEDIARSGGSCRADRGGRRNGAQERRTGRVRGVTWILTRSAAWRDIHHAGPS